MFACFDEQEFARTCDRLHQLKHVCSAFVSTIYMHIFIGKRGLNNPHTTIAPFKIQNVEQKLQHCPGLQSKKNSWKVILINTILVKHAIPVRTVSLALMSMSTFELSRRLIISLLPFVAAKWSAVSLFFMCVGGAKLDGITNIYLVGSYLTSHF